MTEFGPPMPTSLLPTAGRAHTDNSAPASLIVPSPTSRPMR